MPLAVKICCIASVAEARRAIAAGASAIGLVSAMPGGPGVISDALVAEIATAARSEGVRSFLLTARTRAEAIAEQHGRCGTTTLQLVDHVPVAELRRLRALCPGVQVVRVIHVTDERVLEEAHAGKLAAFMSAVAAAAAASRL